MRAVICLWFAVVGILSFLTFIGFFIAIARAVVNHNGGDGAALDPLVWSAGALPKRRRQVHRVLGIGHCGADHLLFGSSEWVNVPASAVSADDVASLALHYQSLG